MKAQIAVLTERFDALSLRERAMIWVASLMLVLVTWYLAFLSPDMARERRLKTDIAAVQTRIDALNAGIGEQASQVADGTHHDDRRRLVSLQKRVADVGRSLEAHQSELIDPAQMATVMEDVLNRQHGLTLVRISNLDPEVLVANRIVGQNALYRHGLRIEIEGSYLAGLRYLEDLEALRWRLYWSLVDVDAGDWPGTRMVIEVSTLSVDEDWIGV